MTDTALSTPAGAPHIEPIERIDISDAVYLRIREMILLGDLAPDSKIDLDYLADSFQVSRTTVANALQRLNLEELVTIVPRRGTFARRFGPEQVNELYEVRLCIELWAAQKSVSHVTDEQLAEVHQILDGFLPLFDSKERSDLAAFAVKNRDFHTYLISLAQNRKMLDMYESLHVDVLGYRIYHIRETRHTVDGVPIQEVLRPARADHEEHEAIVHGYEARALSQVEEAIRTHLNRSLENYIKMYEALRIDPRHDLRDISRLRQER
jgi:DNA-binding GntR family transcriptional regulator